MKEKTKTLECEMKTVERSMTRLKTMIELGLFMIKPYFIYFTARRPEEQRRKIINRTTVSPGVISNKIYLNLEGLLLLFSNKIYLNLEGPLLLFSNKIYLNLEGLLL